MIDLLVALDLDWFIYKNFKAPKEVNLRDDDVDENSKEAKAWAKHRKQNAKAKLALVNNIAKRQRSVARTTDGNANTTLESLIANIMDESRVQDQTAMYRGKPRESKKDKGKGKTDGLKWYKGCNKNVQHSKANCWTLHPEKRSKDQKKKDPKDSKGKDKKEKKKDDSKDDSATALYSSTTPSTAYSSFEVSESNSPTGQITDRNSPTSQVTDRNDLTDLVTGRKYDVPTVYHANGERDI
ncbi:hypothetical protein PVAG01_08437 [Phlyctema vagabunda]|uniref:Uncharacterized protein n=1 Tax=Phlyctema vagabunda TaxID=108571 RepID=A0ABR4P9E3_9HELO